MIGVEDEASLVRRAKRGDPSALTEIYDRCQPAIYRYVFFQVGDAAVAEDLTGEVFVRMVEKIDGFTYRGHPIRGWLYAIARNLVTDHHRRAARSLSLSPDDDLADPADAPEDIFEEQAVQRRLADAIAHLTPDQRQVILLRFIEGLDNETTARIMGKTVGAVKALQHRALAALRRILPRQFP